MSFFCPSHLPHRCSSLTPHPLSLLPLWHDRLACPLLLGSSLALVLCPQHLWVSHKGRTTAHPVALIYLPLRLRPSSQIAGRSCLWTFHSWTNQWMLCIAHKKNRCWNHCRTHLATYRYIFFCVCSFIDCMTHFKEINNVAEKSITVVITKCLLEEDTFTIRSLYNEIR